MIPRWRYEVKNTHILYVYLHVYVYPWVPNCGQFSSTTSRSQDICYFSFYHLPQCYYFFFKNVKNPKRSFVRTIEKKMQEKFENFRLRFVGILSVLKILVPIESHVNENGRKYRENLENEYCFNSIHIRFMARGNKQLKFENKKIHAIGSEIIDATDGRTTNGQISISWVLTQSRRAKYIARYAILHLLNTCTCSLCQYTSTLQPGISGQFITSIPRNINFILATCEFQLYW